MKSVASKGMGPVEINCNFDTAPTHLYMLIQERDWEGVQYQAKHFPEEVSIFVFRKEPSSNLLKWRLLPIHAAFLGDAPVEVFEALLEAYPAGARGQDDHGMLPIHLGIKKHIGPDVINRLLAAYPECIDVQTYQGLTPYQMAEKSSSAHKEYYLRALKRGSPTYSAVTATLSDLLCGISLDLPSMSMDPRIACGTVYDSAYKGGSSVVS